MKQSLRWSVIVLLGIAAASADRVLGESFAFLTPAGTAGQPPPLGQSGDGTNAGARFKSLSGLSVASPTNVYLADTHAIRRMIQTGTNWIVSTLAGNLASHGSFDGTNTAAQFNYPQGIAVDGTGRIYVADTYNHTIRRMVLQGTNWVVTTIAGSAGLGGSVDGSNNVARFNKPYGIAVDNLGTLFVADSQNHLIRRISLSGTNWVVTTIAGLAGVPGPDDGTNTAARLNAPVAIAVDNVGNFYVADLNNHAIRKGAPSGTNWVITTIAGLAGVPGSVDGSNSLARFFLPQGITVDLGGNLYVADSGNNTMRKVKPRGTNWVVNTIGGLSPVFGSNDGAGTSARFNDPYGTGMDSNGTLFVADTMNNTIRSGQLAAVMDYQLAGNKLVISWPVALAITGFLAEASSSLPGVSWASQSGIITNGDTCFLTNSITTGNRFYRLRKP